METRFKTLKNDVEINGGLWFDSNCLEITAPNHKETFMARIDGILMEVENVAIVDSYDPDEEAVIVFLHKPGFVSPQITYDGFKADTLIKVADGILTVN